MAGTTQVGQNNAQMIGNTISQDVPLVGSTVGGLISLVGGLVQARKARRLNKQNPYPTEPIPPEELANQQAAQQMAGEGMPSAQYQAANKNIQRQQAAAIADAQSRRSGGAAAPIIQQQTNDADANLDAASAATRRQNQLNLQTVNSQVAGYRNAAFDWNSKNRYLQQYQYAQSLLGAGNANAISGADKIAGGFAQAGASGLFQGTGNPNSSTTTANPGGNIPGYNATALPSLASTGGSSSTAGLFSTISTLAPLLAI